MNEANVPADLLARLRARDEAAAEWLVHTHGPGLLRFIGHHLSRLGLSRALDPEDVSQEVFAKFFAKIFTDVELGGSLEDLVKLLVTMARDEITDQWRHAHAQRRGGQKHPDEPAPMQEMVDTRQAPDRHLIEQEQIEQIHTNMSDEEWNLAMAHSSGQTWEQIAAEFGQSAEALRKKLLRAYDRVKRDLNAQAPDPQQRSAETDKTSDSQ